MVWISLGTYTAALDGGPELYDLDGRWVELLRDPPDPKPYKQVEVVAEVTSGASYWYVTEDIADIAVSRLRVTSGGCRHEPWIRVSKGIFVRGRQTAKVRRAFALADTSPESAPRFLRKRLVRPPTA
ncbi:MAG: hypothetical protein ACRD0K_11535 [Egibacteraceae bacterium]